MSQKIFLTGIFLIFIFLSFLLTSMPIVSAAEEEAKDITVLGGLELEKLLNLVNGLIALILFIIVFMAYKRDGRRRFLYVSIAFLLFSIKGFLVASELFIPEIPLLDPIIVLLEFIIILSFFFGVLKK